MGAAIFIDEVYDIEIRNGVAISTWSTGERRAVPLAIFRMQLERANRTLAEFDAQREVVPIRRR